MFARIRRLFQREENTPLRASVLSLVDGDLVIKGVTSTTTGITINGGIIRLIAGNQQVIVANSTSFFNSIPFVASAGLYANISGVAMYPVMGGAIFDHFTDGASTSTDGTEDTLKTSTLPAGGLNANGAKLRGFFQVAVVGHVTATARTRLYFGGTAIFDTTAFNSTTNYAMTIRYEIIRVSSTTVRCAVSCNAGVATPPPSTYTEVTGLTLSNAQAITITGVAASTNAAAGDITVKLGGTWWHPASDIDGP